jgi:hypothetical protein
MPHAKAIQIESLRAAIAWALQLADAQKETLIGAFLAGALNHAEKRLDEHRQ